MDGAGEQLLAGAGLALDQDRQVGLGGLARQIAHLGHFLADIDELFEAQALYRASAGCGRSNSVRSEESLNSRASNR